MNVKSFNLSVQGSSHIKRNKECQDASISYHDEKMAIAIVCDGHGGNDYVRSAVGSKCACNAAEKNIKIFLETISKEQFFLNPEEKLKKLEESIINTWNQLIYGHYTQNPFTEEELNNVSEKIKKKYAKDEHIENAYGTTLIAVAMTKEYWFGIHIGDGKCVAINPAGKFVQPIPWDKKCFLNSTTSICDPEALKNFRHFYSEKLPVAVFVGSDGIDDCFSKNEQLHNFYKTILYSFATEEFQKAIDDLKDYLPRLSARGSGDDVSIAVILDFDLVPKLDVVKNFDREKEKARVQENARKEAEKNEAEKRRVELEHAKFQKQNNRKTEHKVKFCTKCGAKVYEGMKFCGECGAKVLILPTKIDLNKNEKQTQFLPIKYYQIKNLADLIKQKDINIIRQEIVENDNIQIKEQVVKEIVIEKEKFDVSKKNEIIILATENDDEIVQTNIKNTLTNSEKNLVNNSEKIIIVCEEKLDNSVNNTIQEENKKTDI